MIPLPCPWCGLEWSHEKQTSKGRPDPPDSTIYLVGNSYKAAVYCPRCNATGPEFNRDGAFKATEGPVAIIPWRGFPGFPRYTPEQIENEAVRLWNERIERTPA